MKNYYLLLFLFIGLFGKAQIINFPDANFKAKLLEANSSNYIAKNSTGDYFKIDANENGEIEVNEGIQIYELDLINSNISSLDGVGNFANLKNLSCPNNQLSSLDLSQNTALVYLFCWNNQLTNLNVTQNILLENLECHNNQLANLNISQNTLLNILQVSNNQLTNLNVTQNIELISLSCGNNQLNSLNVTQNTLLYDLEVYNNQLTNLDITQNIALVELSCEYNQLTNLNLSQNTELNYIECINNQLISLDLSQNSNLQYLNCKNNQLTSINVKNGITEIWNDELTGDITVFSFENNPNLQFICADEAQVIEIQNKIIELGYTNCNVNSYCSFTPGGQFYTIQGQNAFDNENDGCDVTDNFIPNLKYSISNGSITGLIISNNTGNYSIPVQAGTNTITPVLENPSYFNVSPTNVVVNFPTQTSPFTQNFCITPIGEIHDVEISILPLNPARPGFDCNYKIIYKNKGNQTENGTINLVFDDTILDFVSSNVTTSSQTFGNLNWNYSNLQPFETRSINVVLNLNSPMETPAVNSGDILNYTVTNTITNTDEMLSDNTFTLNQTVVNSYDPNDKTCLEGNTISPDRVGGFVHYMIRFENTGTFPAENIVVKDMIDITKFDVSTLVPLNASHNYFTKITGNKVEFIFENINLPFDDTNNDGYVAFKIKTLPSLVVGNTFSNSANIYFDYNFPIVTNTATTTIAALSNPSFEFANYFSLYPNPTKSELNINLKSAIEINSIQIYNTIGQLVTLQTGNALKVDVSNLKTGNYFIKINTKEGFTTSQFIKE